MVAFGAEHRGILSGEGIDLGVDGGHNDGAADGINAGIGNAWRNELAFDGERAKILLDIGLGVVSSLLFV